LLIADRPDWASWPFKSEASLRGHLKAERAEQTGSQSYVPPDESDDKAIKMALDLLRGTATNVAFLPIPRRRFITDEPTLSIQPTGAAVWRSAVT
jgi:hypothetical protein